MKTFSRRTLFWVALFVLLAGAAATELATRVRAQDAVVPARIRDFELLDAQTGWVWHSGDLDWSDDGGASWRRITPGGSDYQLADVHFADRTTGWALLAGTPPGAPARPALVLARTTDAGATWHFAPLPQAVATTLAAAKKVFVLPHAGEAGWIAADRAVSSNFSRGVLWYTDDGGATWQERTLPVGEPMQFDGAQFGWVAGGPRGDELWRTPDGGLTWQAMPLPRRPAAGERIEAYTPQIGADGTLALPLLIRSEREQTSEWYTSRDRGTTWELVQHLPLAPGADRPLDASDARAWLASRAEGVLPPVEPLPYFASLALGSGERLMQVKMATAQDGLALAQQEDRGATLLATQDGGETWRPVALAPVAAPADRPLGQPQSSLSAADAYATVARTSIARGHGFDTCNFPFLSELATWRAASPYRSVNLYIGGRLHACPDRQPTKDQIAAASDQGWTFIPTWVGLQAPCSPYPSNSFSYNPGEAFNQGVAEADAAIEAARRLGLAQDDGSGTIIYYNMEAYDGSNEGCVAAAQAFIAGWSGRLRARGSQAGLYGLACNPPMGRYAGSSSPPDAVWMAGWNRDFFDAEMTVWDIFCVSDTLWARSQRIRQYTGGHDETWGGVTLNIDSNVLDSIVADLDAAPPATPTPTPTPTATPTPQPTVVLETARLDPPYADGMCGAGWHLLVNDRGYPTYLAANRDRNGTIPPGAEELSAAWDPVIPTDGFYRVEAYIPDHGIIQWLCPEARLVQDTASAYYTVRHAEGTTIKVGNQGPLRNGWLLLGVYPFRAGQTASVTLSTATDEAAYTRTVAASALRLMRLENGAAGSHFLYLPQLNNRR